jgi:uncharacterized protein
MSLEQTLNDTLTQAIRDKDQRMADIVRMIKSRITERRTAKGFSGRIDDAVVQDVIGSYRKSLQKALPDYDKVGERGRAQAEQLRFEIDVLARWLPKGLDEDALRSLVRERLTALAITDPKQIGRLLGDLMKTHKGQVEAADIKRIAEELLTAK